ncbi:MAG: transglutaminase family protein [Trebonia sp.]
MMLDRSVLQAPLLDHRGLDLGAVRKVDYVLQQSFRYEYDAPVNSLRQRLVIVPPARHGNQYRRAHLLEVNGAPARRRVSRDAYGNVVAWLHADRVPRAIEFRLAAVIERVRDDGPTLLPADALRNPRLLRPTPLTAADERLRDLAADIAATGSDPEDTAQRMCDVVSKAITYSCGVTSVKTTAAEALAVGRGVCQDFAHVMLALCHLVQLPARYVSGHDRRTDSGYVTVATGRDYSDVAPTSGSYVGTSSGRLTTDRKVGVLAAA